MTYAAEALAIGFNSKLLLDALAILDADREVALGCNDEVSPVTLRRTGTDEGLYVVMPMRL